MISLKTPEVYREELIQDIYDGDTEIEGDGSDIEVVEEIELEEIIPSNLQGTLPKPEKPISLKLCQFLRRVK